MKWYVYALDFVPYWKPENVALEPIGPGLTWCGHRKNFLGWWG